MEKSVKELLEALSGKSELLKELEKMWKDGDAKKIAALIEKAGIKTDIETVEKVLAELQKKTAEKIKDGKVDDSQLQTIAGGGSGDCYGAADCDRDFKNHPEEENRCSVFSKCDEVFFHYEECDQIVKLGDNL